MKRKGTNWSSPKTNIFSAIACLSTALQAGHDAILIKEWNENCLHPILDKKGGDSIYNYKSTGAVMMCAREVKERNYPNVQKDLMLNYKVFFGTPEAADHYRRTGELSNDNFKGISFAHSINREDAAKHFESKRHYEHAERIRRPNSDDEVFWVDTYTTLPQNQRLPKRFKSKLWVVQLVDNKTPMPWFCKLYLNIIKVGRIIPKKRVLQMDKYKTVTYRWGQVSEGFSIEFHIPKKFKW